ncbi:MAG TPA: tRNA (guanosine(37)-N1)-methyltransferase TrmD [Tepidisphaeraceae bacterium]|jgi:tRNA (guanine37-N1)-methyltransferase|nr:tRNA (guanosine(37)-N1)-methyltransferase TrmD [Tepidisphaeraceae bacterium]
MSLRFDILTLFPEMFVPILGTSIPKRAAEKGLVEYRLTNFRDFATDAHKSVDDKPFGGGPGMVMMCQTMFDAVEFAEKQDARPATRILLTPQGRLFDQKLAEELATKERLLLIAGHYEGFDERIINGLSPLEISIGDYVLSGGELAAMVIVDAVVRLLPGALGAEHGAVDETFAEGLLEYPQYTRPRDFRGMSVPDVLLSGNHAAIAQWRESQRKTRTQSRRPDLWQRYLQDRKKEDL